MNERSSRSHSILILEQIMSCKDGSERRSKLNLVDLAGSERIGKTGATGSTLKEAQNINQSLSTLGRVIEALGKGSLPPFRESQLTRLLKESLGGNSKTTLICTASRHRKHAEETLQSLQFAKRVKLVKNKAVAIVTRSKAEMEKLIVKLEEEIRQLKEGRTSIVRRSTRASDAKIDFGVEAGLETRNEPLLNLPADDDEPLLNEDDLSLELLRLQTAYEELQ
jgi:kinesin family member 5